LARLLSGDDRQWEGYAKSAETDEIRFNGHYRSHDLSAWVVSNPPDVLAANLGLPLTVA
jgi:hypothetical protein